MRGGELASTQGRKRVGLKRPPLVVASTRRQGPPRAERSRRLGPLVRSQRRAVGARRGGERARADRGRLRVGSDRNKMSLIMAEDMLAGHRPPNFISPEIYERR